MNSKRMSVILLAGVLGLHGCVGSPDSIPPAEMSLENLLQVALADEFTPDREIIVSYVEFPPHTKMDRHWHPGETIIYFLEGEAEITIDEAPNIFGTPGTVGHIPYRAIHTAITGDKGAKAVVFRVHIEGQPIRILEVDEGAGR